MRPTVLIALALAVAASGCDFIGGETRVEQAASACEERAERDDGDDEDDDEDVDLSDFDDDELEERLASLLNPEFEFHGSVEDDGNTYILSGAPDDSAQSTNAYQSLLCVLDELDASEALINRLGSTRALDGQQDRVEDGIEYTWSYHPNSGISFMAELIDQ